MANYAESVLSAAQVMLNQRFQSAELRYKPSPILMKLLQNRDFLIPDLQTLRDREDRVTKAYLKNRASRATGSARAHNHTGTTAGSTEVSITYTPYTDKFQTSLKRGDNNVFSNAQILAHEMENAFINLYEGIETALVTWLDTNKNQVSAPPSGSLKSASFNAVNDVYEINASDANRYWQIVKSVFTQEKYKGMIDMVSDSLSYINGEFYANQGTGNSTNTGFQFSGVDVAESIEVSDATYVNGFSFAWPQGLAGILDWIPPVNRRGEGDMMSYNGGFGTIIDPMTGLPFAVHGYSQRADTSSANGNVQDVVTEFELSIDLSPQKAPLTTANASPIFALGIPT